MKKTLLASTAALTLVAFSGAASAQVEVSIGGYYDFEFGAAGNDQEFTRGGTPLPAGQDLEEFGFRTDAEIHFDVRGTTDNGLNFGAEVELEVSDEQDTGNIDESWLFISGDPWGEFRGGFTDGPMADGQIAAPTVTPIGVNDGTQGDFIIFPATGLTGAIIAGGAALDTATELSSDDLKAIYYTPRFSGVQLGVSFTPDFTTGGNNRFVAERDTGYSNEIQVALNYEGSFQSVDVLAGFNYAFAEAGDLLNDADPASDDFHSIHAGLNLGWGGFTFGGGYGNVLNGGIGLGAAGDVDGDGINDVSRESWGFDVGAAYGQGPWEVSAVYYYGEADGAEGSGAITEEVEHQSVLVGGSYALGAGLTTYAGVGYSEYEGQTPGTDLDDNDGVWGFVGTTVSF
jgi:predicted porin